jgi:hypothetical protein
LRVDPFAGLPGMIPRVSRGDSRPAMETDAHLWAERFDSDTEDLFALQNEITVVHLVF